MNLVDEVFPLIDQVSDQLEDVESAILKRVDRRQLQQLMRLKRWLISMRRVLSPERDMLAILLRRGDPRISERTALYFRDVYDHVVRAYEQIDVERDLLGNAMDAYLSMMANGSTIIMKQLTLLASIFLPLTFMTGFFGQNFNALPFEFEVTLLHRDRGVYSAAGRHVLLVSPQRLAITEPSTELTHQVVAIARSSAACADIATGSCSIPDASVVTINKFRYWVRRQSSFGRFHRVYPQLMGVERYGRLAKRAASPRRSSQRGQQIRRGEDGGAQRYDRVARSGESGPEIASASKATTKSRRTSWRPSLAKADPKVLHDLHVVQSGIVLPEHIDLFEKGIAKEARFLLSPDPRATHLARVLKSGKIELGAIHTYIELFGRYFIDLTPHVALTVARSADRDGNLYMGPNTEDSPVVIEATAFKQGIVVAQVNEVVDKLPRVDIPGDRVDFVVETPKPFYVEPLFTRDPASITETQILAAMMAIKGIYAEYGIKRLNHGIGFNTAAIELLLPTYADKLGLKGKIATHWALNPHPTLIPAIEFGVGETDPQLRFRGGHGCLHARAI